MLLDIGGVDYPGREPRFDVVYHLFRSPRARTVAEVGTPARVRVLCGVEEGDRCPDGQRSVAGGGLGRREVYDLFGVRL